MSNTQSGPSGIITKFDKGAYTSLANFVDSVDKDAETTILRPTTGPVLDSSLAKVVKPGMPSWAPANKMIQNCGTFGSVVHTELTHFAAELAGWHDALLKGSDQFEMTGAFAVKTARSGSPANPV